MQSDCGSVGDKPAEGFAGRGFARQAHPRVARRRGLVEQAGCANDRDQPAVTALHWVSVAAILAPLVPLIALIVQLCRAPIGR